MKYPINSTFETHLLKGAKVIFIHSVNFDSANKDYTHALLELPKEYLFHKERNSYATFVYVKVSDLEKNWYDAIIFFSNKAYAKKTYFSNLEEDRHYNYLIKKKKESESINQ